MHLALNRCLINGGYFQSDSMAAYPEAVWLNDIRGFDLRRQPIVVGG